MSPAAVLLATGSYTAPRPMSPHAHGDGVVVHALDPETAVMREVARHAVADPSFLLVDPASGLLHACCERAPGQVVSLRFDGRTLSRWATVPTGDDAPCHLAFDPSGSLLMVSHVESGSVTLVPACSTSPGGVRPAWRLGGPHSCASVPGADAVVVADTAGDRLVVFVSVHGTYRESSSVELGPGVGPRHLCFNRDGSIVFASAETGRGVSVVAVDRGSEGDVDLRLLATVASAGFGRAPSTPSEIARHPTRDVVYVANRYDESLSVFEADGAGLALRGVVDARVRNPRHFTVLRDCSGLLVAGQDSDAVTLFRLSPDGLALDWSGVTNPVASPTCVVELPPEPGGPSGR